MTCRGVEGSGVLGGKVRSVVTGWRLSGSFAALRMTAESVDNGGRGVWQSPDTAWTMICRGTGRCAGRDLGR
ncbi:hypothetical protein HDF12_002388 [Edaphobacter lichenicola]|uniref:Uncharacterized protein n=1 Tax=Tunturiibacter lichenicola TaxID=2051959 RepID=A0A7Y9NME1_9BACT|nr:hypothetical protein [Edaphobacter lichenicola]